MPNSYFYSILPEGIDRDFADQLVAQYDTPQVQAQERGAGDPDRYYAYEQDGNLYVGFGTYLGPARNMTAQQADRAIDAIDNGISVNQAYAFLADGLATAKSRVELGAQRNGQPVPEGITQELIAAQYQDPVADISDETWQRIRAKDYGAVAEQLATKAPQAGELLLSNIPRQIDQEGVLFQSAVRTSLSEVGSSSLMDSAVNVRPDTGGTTSYGWMGLNTGLRADRGSIHDFQDRYGASLGLTGQPGTPEFDETWAAADPEALNNAQLEWHNETHIEPAANLLTDAGLTEFVNDPGVISSVADSIVQEGGLTATDLRNTRALLGENATREEFFNVFEQQQLASIPGNFRTALSDGTASLAGLQRRVRDRSNNGRDFLEGGSASNPTLDPNSGLPLGTAEIPASFEEFQFDLSQRPTVADELNAQAGIPIIEQPDTVVTPLPQEDPIQAGPANDSFGVLRANQNPADPSQGTFGVLQADVNPLTDEQRLALQVDQLETLRQQQALDREAIIQDRFNTDRAEFGDEIASIREAQRQATEQQEALNAQRLIENQLLGGLNLADIAGNNVDARGAAALLSRETVQNPTTQTTSNADLFSLGAINGVDTIDAGDIASNLLRQSRAIENQAIQDQLMSNEAIQRAQEEANLQRAVNTFNQGQPQRGGRQVDPNVARAPDVFQSLREAEIAQEIERQELNAIEQATQENARLQATFASQQDFDPTEFLNQNRLQNQITGNLNSTLRFGDNGVISFFNDLRENEGFGSP